MLEITIPEREMWLEDKEEFVYIKETHLQLEHSLISLKKWESKWHKPFLEEKDLTEEEIRDYIRCMTLTKGVDPDIYRYITPSVKKEIIDYIKDPMTATWFSKRDQNGVGKKRIVTAEIIYYWMITLNIPVQFEKWHLNQLMTLIRVCNAENATPKKMSKRDILTNNARINAARRAKHKSKG
jgi:hypothetical protein